MNLEPLFLEIVSLLGAAFVAIVGWLARKFAQKLNVDNEKALVEAVRGVAKEIVEALEKKADKRGDNLQDATTHLEYVDKAASALLEEVPDWLKRAGITEQGVRSMVKNLLP